MLSCFHQILPDQGQSIPDTNCHKITVITRFSETEHPVLATFSGVSPFAGLLSWEEVTLLRILEGMDTLKILIVLSGLYLDIMLNTQISKNHSAFLV